MRLIGVRHRVKKTAKGEARPTMVAIKDGDQTVVHELADDQAELDFLLHLFPIAWRPAADGDNPSSYQARHCKWKKDEESGAQVLAQIPIEFEGLQPDDVVLMSLGGSGDRFAAALSRRGEEVGAKVCRIPPFHLKDLRGEADKNDDHLNLIRIFEFSQQVFREMTPKDRALIRVREAYFARQEAQRARIGCEQRLRQQFIGKIFLSEEGRYPEGEVEALFDEAKANDKVFQGLLAEEKQRDRDLKLVVHVLPVWKIFEGVEGAGENIAAGIVSAVGDIRRFASEKKLKAFCGAHVMPDGSMPRRRTGQVANWSKYARQALYLLADQFNRRPDSVWGQKLREYKVKLRERHPIKILVASKFSTLLRRIERLFLAEGLAIDTSKFDLKSPDGLYEYFAAGKTELNRLDELNKTELMGRGDEALKIIAEEFELIAKSTEKATTVVQVFSPGHIHKMALRCTATKFVEWLYREWTKLETEAPVSV